MVGTSWYSILISEMLPAPVLLWYSLLSFFILGKLFVKCIATSYSSFPSLWFLGGLEQHSVVFSLTIQQILVIVLSSKHSLHCHRRTCWLWVGNVWQQVAVKVLRGCSSSAPNFLPKSKEVSTEYCFENKSNSDILLHSAWWIMPGSGNIWSIRTFPNFTDSLSILDTCRHWYYRSTAMRLSSSTSRRKTTKLNWIWSLCVWFLDRNQSDRLLCRWNK